MTNKKLMKKIAPVVMSAAVAMTSMPYAVLASDFTDSGVLTDSTDFSVSEEFAAEDAQVDGIERKLGQNTRQNRRDAHERVENARREAGEHADQKRRDHRDPHVAAADDEHGGHRAAGCDAAVHRQIGHIEDSIGNIHANRHDAPDHALRTGAGERVKQLGNLHWIVLLMIRMKPRERSAASLAHADVFENRFYSIAT